jgi:hypothetical protein
MNGTGGKRIMARCVVCKGDIYEDESHEIWEDAYYCRRHSLTYLRARAAEYAKLLAEKGAQAPRN